MKAISKLLYMSDEGKVFQNKKTKVIMGCGICLGDNDSIKNYEEVDCPEEHKGNKDYDNTVKSVKKSIEMPNPHKKINIEG